MAASQAQAASASTVTAAPSLPAEHFLNEAGREVTRYRVASGLAMEEAQESGKILYPDPLDWWRINAVKFPLLAALARRLLTIPASQAQSERVFSSAGQIVTQTLNRLSSEKVELLVALKNIWSVVEEWQQSKATPVGCVIDCCKLGGEFVCCVSFICCRVCCSFCLLASTARGWCC